MNNKAVMAENIENYLAQKAVNSRQMALDLGFKYTTVRDWINAKTYPRVDKIEKMAAYFGIEKSDLIEARPSLSDLPVATALVERSKQLTKDQQEKLLRYSDYISRDQEAVDYETYYITGRVSAGRGIWQEDDFEEAVRLPKDIVPSNSDAIAQVVGDSMLPKYHNGDLLFVKFDKHIDYGQIGLFKYNGENFVKKLRATRRGGVYLESLNPAYDDIVMDEHDELYTIGKVIGSFSI